MPNGQFGENCYLVADTARREAVLSDTGEEPGVFLAELDTRAWSLTGIWLTHAPSPSALSVIANQTLGLRATASANTAS